MRRLFTLAHVLILSAFPTLVHAQVPAGDAADFKLLYCRSQEAASELEDEAVRAVGRIATATGRPIRMTVQRRICGSEMPDASCFAGQGGLACRASALERVVMAAEFLVARWFEAGSPPYEAFHAQEDRAVVTAFRQADGLSSDGSLAELARLARTTDVDSASASERDLSMAQVRRFVVDRALAVIVGHELSHVNGDTCPVVAASAGEANGSWAAALRSHSDAGLFCARPLLSAEVLADRCALRFLRALDEVSLPPKADGLEGTARRLAADVAAYLGYFGVRKQTAAGALTPPRLSGYLHDPFRSILFAAEIHGARSRPAVCGTAARLFVQATQATYKWCGGKGLVSDEILARLPIGVEASWSGAPWTAASWTCAEQ